MLDEATELVKERREDLARTISAEARKLTTTRRSRHGGCADTLAFDATEARKLTGESVPIGRLPRGRRQAGPMLRAPYGVVNAVSPFNFPLNLIAHRVIAATADSVAVHMLLTLGVTVAVATKLEPEMLGLVEELASPIRRSILRPGSAHGSGRRRQRSSASRTKFSARGSTR